LQRTNSDADYFSDFLATLAAPDQILNLLDALRCELDLAARLAKLVLGVCARRVASGCVAHRLPTFCGLA
jgi:hypothetical protein